MIRLVLGAIGAVVLAVGQAAAAPVPAPTQNDYVFDTVFTGAPGGNYCGGALTDCTYQGSYAIVKFDFVSETGAVKEITTSSRFASIDGSEFSFDFSNGFRWDYRPDDANDPGITGFYVKGSNKSRLYDKTSAAFAYTTDFSDTWTTFNGQLGGLSNIVFFDSLTPVPVPAALPLLGTALAGMAYWRRRQKLA